MRFTAPVRFVDGASLKKNSCDVGRPDLTEKSSKSSARVRACNNKNASLHNFNCSVCARDEVSCANKTLCIQRNMDENTMKDSNYFCDVPTKCTCKIKYMYYYQHYLTFISVFNQLDAQNLFHNKFYFTPLHVSSTCVHHQEVKIALHSL